jgi:DNA-directed RNA polymerase specialized sigma24 family protein
MRSQDDDEGVTAFVRASYGRLLHEAFLLCGDAGRAEDLVQTTLAKTVVAWSRLQRSEGIDNYVQRGARTAHRSGRARRGFGRWLTIQRHTEPPLRLAPASASRDASAAAKPYSRICSS